MTSEELTHRYPNDEGQKVGDMEVFQTQLTTLAQYAKHGLLPDTEYGPYATQKCDALIIRRQPVLMPVVIGEDKATGGVTASNWKRLAKSLLEKKLIPTKTAIGYLTDGARTHWINGAADEVVEIVREDGKPMPTKIDFNDEAFVAELQFIVDHFDSVTGKVVSPIAADPHALAQQVWQTIGFYPEITDGCKRASNFRSCLATLRRILGLWNRSMYSNTSVLAASSVGYFMRWTRSRLSKPKKPSQAALSPQ